MYVYCVACCKSVNILLRSIAQNIVVFKIIVGVINAVKNLLLKKKNIIIVHCIICTFVLGRGHWQDKEDRDNKNNFKIYNSTIELGR